MTEETFLIDLAREWYEARQAFFAALIAAPQGDKAAYIDRMAKAEAALYAYMREYPIA